MHLAATILTTFAAASFLAAALSAATVSSATIPAATTTISSPVSHIRFPNGCGSDVPAPVVQYRSCAENQQDGL